MAIIRRGKKRKIIIGTVLATVVVVIGATIFIFGLKQSRVEKADNTVITEEVTEAIYETNKMLDIVVEDDERFQYFNYITLFQGINMGDIVDVRINFPNGEDYIVLSHKEIINKDEMGIVLKVNEEDIMKMSSANIDMSKYEGTKIYAVKYINANQSPSKSYYLLNEYVLSLCEWNPNLINKVFSQEKLKKRYDFEQNLVKFQIEKEVG